MPDVPHTADRWKNRRRMAWAALVAGLAFPVLLLLTQSDQLGALAGPFYVFVGAVVGAYIGFATVDDKWQSGERWDRWQGQGQGYGQPDRYDRWAATSGGDFPPHGRTDQMR